MTRFFSLWSISLVLGLKSLSAYESPNFDWMAFSDCCEKEFYEVVVQTKNWSQLRTAARHSDNYTYLINRAFDDLRVPFSVLSDIAKSYGTTGRDTMLPRLMRRPIDSFFVIGDKDDRVENALDVFHLVIETRILESSLGKTGEEAPATKIYSDPVFRKHILNVIGDSAGGSSEKFEIILKKFGQIPGGPEFFNFPEAQDKFTKLAADRLKEGDTTLLEYLYSSKTLQKNEGLQKAFVSLVQSRALTNNFELLNSIGRSPGYWSLSKDEVCRIYGACFPGVSLVQSNTPSSSVVIEPKDLIER